jgi:hypothetical protein
VIAAAKERWADVPGWPYQVSDLGRVRRAAAGKSTHAGRIIREGAKSARYRKVCLHRKPHRRTAHVHRLVACAFLRAPPFEGAQVNHKNGDKLDNRVANLEWVTPRQNTVHAMDAGLGARGERIGASRLTDVAVREIRAEYTGAPGELAEMARRLGVGVPAIRRALTGKTWQHVGGPMHGGTR